MPSLDYNQNVEQSLEKLNSILPLAKRQDALPDGLVKLHRSILYALADRGEVPDKTQLSRLTGITDLDSALARLAQDDLVVLDSGTGEVLGAYPLTTEDTPHQLSIDGVPVHAMCAVDALSVASVFDKQVEIRSRCHVTGVPILIRQTGKELLGIEPEKGIQVGIHWQSTQGCAAHSLCMEMIFLRDQELALQWRAGEMEQKSLLTLEEAIALGIAFFAPLLQE